MWTKSSLAFARLKKIILCFVMNNYKYWMHSENKNCTIYIIFSTSTIAIPFERCRCWNKPLIVYKLVIPCKGWKISISLCLSVFYIKRFDTNNFFVIWLKQLSKTEPERPSGFRPFWLVNVNSYLKKNGIVKLKETWFR